MEHLKKELDEKFIISKDSLRKQNFSRSDIVEEIIQTNQIDKLDESIKLNFFYFSENKECFKDIDYDKDETYEIIKKLISLEMEICNSDKFIESKGKNHRISELFLNNMSIENLLLNYKRHKKEYYLEQLEKKIRRGDLINPRQIVDLIEIKVSDKDLVKFIIKTTTYIDILLCFNKSSIFRDLAKERLKEILDENSFVEINCYNIQELHKTFGRDSELDSIALNKIKCDKMKSYINGDGDKMKSFMKGNNNWDETKFHTIDMVYLFLEELEKRIDFGTYISCIDEVQFGRLMKNENFYLKIKKT